MPQLQTAIRLGRRVIPRGWSPLLRGLARVLPGLQAYPARMRDGERLILDLRESMCHGLFYDAAPPAHEEGVERVIRRVLRPGAVFADVGANIGYYTRVAASVVGPEGAVHAFEPMPAALRLLRANAAGLSNVRVHDTAVGDRIDQVEFFVSPAGERSSLGPGSGGERVVARMEPLDHALAGAPRLDMIKIDVEGFELAVLRGARTLIERHRPVVCFELLDQYARSYGFDFGSYEAFFLPLGYDLAWVCADGSLRELPEGEARDVLATPR